MRVGFFETAPWERRFLARAPASHKRLSVTFDGRPLTEETLPLARSAEILSVFIDSHLGSSILGKLPTARLVATRSTPPPREPRPPTNALVGGPRLSGRGGMGERDLAKREAGGAPPVRVGGSTGNTL